MILSRAMPNSSARAALFNADDTMASRVISAASFGEADFALSSIIWVTMAWSRLPQLTPIRTGRSYIIAVSIIEANWLSFLSPNPTLPGLMRYFASASAQAGLSVSSLWPI